MRMGKIADIRSSLREAAALRVRYATAEGDSGVLRMLPPRERFSAQGVTVVTNIELNEAGSGDGMKIKDRNLFWVLINGSGAILAGQPGRQEIIDLPDLSARVKEFVCNAENRANMPEQVVRKFELPGGGEMEYPVSQGIVAMQVARDTPYGVYIDAQNAISKAFGDIRCLKIVSTALIRCWTRPGSEL